MRRIELPRCDYSDLERISCACPRCETFTLTDDERALRSGVHRIGDLKPETQKRYRVRERAEHGTWQWEPGVTPQPVDCQHPSDTELCQPCWDMLQLCLGDIPATIQELNTAIAKDTAFVQHGHRPDAPDRPDESPVPINLGATAALGRLAQALRVPAPANGWTLGQAVVVASRRLIADRDLRLQHGVGDWAASVTTAVVHARKLIDRPADRWFYGTCPQCHTDIYDDRGITEVHCYDCGYTARLVVHHRLMIDQREDEWLTVDELVGVFTKAGQPISRHQIKNLAARHGLSRKKQNKPRWVKDRHGNDRITTSEVWVHKIGDVRDLLTELADTA